MSWSAKQYTTFEDERTRPVRDLLNGVPNTQVRRAMDLGCGPGNSTQVLATRFPDAQIGGLDSSQDMIDAARARLPGLRFDVAAIDTWHGEGAFDIILANAALQWVAGHDTLFPRLVEGLAPGGTLAVQVPDNMGEPAQLLMRTVAAQEPWRATFAALGEPRVPRNDPEWYYALLRPLCSRLDMWCTTYFHPLAGGADALVEWFKGSGLRPFLAQLDASAQRDYLARYREAVAEAYPALPDGSVLLPFPRLFIVATR